jgi:hypothetical protein
MSTTLAATRKRLNFLTGRPSVSNDGEKTTKGRKGVGNVPKIGEMGEILAEEEEKPVQEPHAETSRGVVDQMTPKTVTTPIPIAVVPVVESEAAKDEPKAQPAPEPPAADTQKVGSGEASVAVQPTQTEQSPTVAALEEASTTEPHVDPPAVVEPVTSPEPSMPESASNAGAAPEPKATVPDDVSPGAAAPQAEVVQAKLEENELIPNDHRHVDEESPAPEVVPANELAATPSAQVPANDGNGQGKRWNQVRSARSDEPI